MIKTPDPSGPGIWKKTLLGLLMKSMLPVKFAELFDFKTTGSIFLLLGSRVVSAFALGAFKCYDFTHCTYLFL